MQSLSQEISRFYRCYRIGKAMCFKKKQYTKKYSNKNFGVKFHIASYILA